MSRQEPSRIYVAGRFSAYERCRALMDRLRALGHTISHDWTRTEEFGPDGRPRHRQFDKAAGPPPEIPPHRLAMHAQDDVRGVRTADLVVVIADEQLCGALIEAGVALALGVPVWVIAPWRWTIFWNHPLVTRFSCEEAVLRFLSNE